MKTLYFLLLLLAASMFIHMPAPMAAPLAELPPVNDIHSKIAEFKDLLARQTDREIIKKAAEIDEKSKAAFAADDPARTLRLLAAGIAYLKDKHSIDIDAVLKAEDPSAPLTGAGNPIYDDSPFGVLGPYEYWMSSRDVASKEEINRMLSDLGVKWVEEMPFELKNLSGNINIYTRVGTFPGIFPPEIDYAKFEPLLKNQILSFKNRVKYYEIDTEPLGKFSAWDGHADKYAEFMRKSYAVIKSACPECSVVLGGLPGAGVSASEKDSNGRFLHDIMKGRGNTGKLFDVFAFKQHFHSLQDYRILKTRLDIFRRILSGYGVNISKMPIFIETAIYDGSPRSRMFNLPPHTETDQAVGVVKTYVYALSIGISKIYWNGVMELYNFGGNPDDPFNFYALVNNRKNDGNSHKKLAYYTYKKMVETLEGSDWKHIETVKDSGGVFVCKFLRGGRRIWVVWNDTSGTAPVTINVDGALNLRITTSVPTKVSSGKQVTDYNSAFVVRTEPADENGEFSIDAGPVPVYIEEL
ncbi:MAG: hypothetical protein L7F77_09055 [Candidatus Magnetominusculus sp. LBB02]|nr:hypothetical protein [Candidatus Magnetominusculus sp. LBB02]